MKKMLLVLMVLLGSAGPSWAEGAAMGSGLSHSGWGYLSLILFAAAYAVVIFEEKLHLRKSKPIMFAAGLIWVFVALAVAGSGAVETVHEAIEHNLTEYAELFLFLLAAMTYINALEERNVFQALRNWLVSKGFSLRVIFWLTGALAFFISPVADNLTTALLMGAVVMAVGGSNQRFVVVSCISVVIAANAGGAFSPFGDITTLMVWQKGKLSFFEFFRLFLPALVNWLVPAIIMNFTISRDKPQTQAVREEMKKGAKRILVLFLLTIVTAVCFHNFLHLPPAIGMMLGLSYLGLFSWYLKRREDSKLVLVADNPLDVTSRQPHGFDLFRKIANAEWDTLLFFYGVIFCVGGIAQFGYLALASTAMYDGLGPTSANVLIGLLSAVVDNIPVMFAVLTMDPHMTTGQWMLVTLTAGVGGSLLSVGSAAGVALMGSARGVYTFGRHLAFFPAIALGYAASILLHLLINGRYLH